ncbi:MAG TPA: transcription antitermination factor NusB [Holophagaceae bacterium]|nr:transcription antitermination factor NusB [Holophagaceae bacterium]
MGVRRRGREYALQMLYAMDLTEYQPDQVFAGFAAIQDLNRDAFYYARRLVDGVHSHQEEIDTVLQRYAEHWKLHRMAAVDRNLLRLGLFELMFVKEIPFPIIINEALEIVKEFSDAEGTQFLNGILDAARKEFRPDEGGPRKGKPAAMAEPPDPPLPDEA